MKNVALFQYMLKENGEFWDRQTEFVTEIFGPIPLMQRIQIRYYRITGFIRNLFYFVRSQFQ